jgi:hypothetical protein
MLWVPLNESKFDKAQEIGVNVATLEKIYKVTMESKFLERFGDSVPAGWKEVGSYIYEMINDPSTNKSKSWIGNGFTENTKQMLGLPRIQRMLATGDLQIYPYGLFFQLVNEEVRKKLETRKREESPEDIKIDISDVQREVGEHWRIMQNEEKQVWKNKAEDARHKSHVLRLESRTIFE